MPFVFTHKFDTQAYKGETEFNTGLFINGQFVDGSNNTYIEYVCPRLQHIILTFLPPALSTPASVPSFLKIVDNANDAS